jgi:FkbM family methyltransferase
MSISLNFEKYLQWKGVLIEAVPNNYVSLKKNRPDQITVHAAMCSEVKEVHMIDRTTGVGGILEFMGAGKVRDYHPELASKLANPSTKQQALDSLAVVQCLPLAPLLAGVHMRHINLFVLDVEGGELEVLKSINFETVRFDVIAIETDDKSQSAQYEQITALLQNAGYNLYAKVGVNTWYVRKGFEPSKKP